jgi:hypothetical protein
VRVRVLLMFALMLLLFSSRVCVSTSTAVALADGTCSAMGTYAWSECSVPPLSLAFLSAP